MTWIRIGSVVTSSSYRLPNHTSCITIIKSRFWGYFDFSGDLGILLSSKTLTYILPTSSMQALDPSSPKSPPQLQASVSTRKQSLVAQMSTPLRSFFSLYFLPYQALDCFYESPLSFACSIPSQQQLDLPKFSFFFFTAQLRSFPVVGWLRGCFWVVLDSKRRWSLGAL